MPKLNINQFFRGQTTSPYTTDGAFWKSCNLDIWGQEGIARINYKPTGVVSSQSIMRTGFGIDVFDKVYFSDVVIDSTHGCVKYFDMTTKTIDKLGSSKRYLDSITYWKGYLIGTPSAVRYAEIGGSENLRLSYNRIPLGVNQNWGSFGTFLFQYAGVRYKIAESLINGKLYYTDGFFVGQLEENVGEMFNPSNGSTYTHTPYHLEHHKDVECRNFEDFGRFLAVFTNDRNRNRTIIFLWDVDTPVVDSHYIINEPNMTRTVKKDGIIYIAGGKRGNIYTLSESGLRLYATIKLGDYDNQNYLHKDVHFNSMAWWKDKLMVGIDVVSGSTLTPAGIYSVKNGVVNHEFIPSNGLTDHTLSLGGMLSFQDYLIYGAGNGTVNYLDYIRDDANRLSSGCYLETPLLRVGYKMQKGNIDRIEVNLARKLKTGDGFTLKYRKSLEDNYITLATKSYETDGAFQNFVLDGIKDVDNLQIRIDLKTGASSKNTPMVSEITLF